MATAGEFTKTSTVKVITPKAHVKWAKILEPDYKFDANGTFSIMVIVGNKDDKGNICILPEFESLVKDINATLTDAFNETVELLKGAKKSSLSEVSPIREEEDADGNPTGVMYMRFKMTHKVTSKKDGKQYLLKPKLVDSKNVEIKSPNFLIGNDSVCRIQGELSPYYKADNNTVGLSCRLQAVQLNKLVEYNAVAFDEDEDEDGYTTGEGEFGSEVATPTATSRV